jgi:triosephosphate isomerase
VNSKIKAALANGISPILCVGESAAIRAENGQVAHVISQLKSALSGITPAQVKKIVIAYEPIWAIGTGNVATPEDAQTMAQAIRAQIAKSAGAEIGESMRILYGGSVKSGTIREIMAGADVDGALVGGASLEPEEFARISKFHR